MPSLKQINCAIEWDNTRIPFREYGVKYGDGLVDCFIAIPEAPVAFAIHLDSNGYIAPGLAMFVYMDGIYQCNRNRFGLQILARDTPKKLSEVDFRVRQKEERRADGGWVGRSWRFENLRIVNGDATNEPPKEHFDDLGTIHIIVLRCQPPGSDSSPGPFSSIASTPANSPTSISGARSTGGSKHGSNADIFSVDGSVERPGWFNVDGPSDWGGGPNWSFNGHGQNRGGYGGQVPGQWPGQQMNQQGWNRQGPQGHYNNSPAGSISNFPQHGPSGVGYSNTPHGSEYGGGDRDRYGWGGSQHSAMPSGSQRSGPPSPTDWGHGGPGGGNAQDNWDNRSNFGAQHGGSQHGGWSGNAGNNANPHQNWGNANIGGPNQQQTWHNNGGGNWNSQQNTSGGTGWSGGHGSGNNNLNGSNVGSNNGGLGPSGNSWGGNGGTNFNSQNNSSDWNNGSNAPNSNNQNQGNSGDWASGNDGSNNQGGSSGWGNNNDSGNQGGNNGDSWDNNDNNQNTDSNTWEGNGNTGGNNGSWGNDNDASGGNDWGADNSNTGNQDSSWDNNNNDNSASNDWGNNNNTGSGNNDWNQNNSRPPSKPASIAGSLRSVKTAWITPVTAAQQGDEPPMYTVPEQVAEELKSTHQVQPGQSAPYTHKFGRPSYMDTMDHPYARFIFRYRTKEAVEQELGITIEKDKEEEKRRLATLSKEQIIEILLNGGDSHRSQACTPRTRTPTGQSQSAQPQTYITPMNVASFTNTSATSQAHSARSESGTNVPSKSSDIASKAPRKSSTASSKAPADAVGTTGPKTSRKTLAASTQPPADITTSPTPENPTLSTDLNSAHPEPDSAASPNPPEPTPSLRRASSHGSMAAGALDVDTLTAKLQDLKTQDEKGSMSRSRGNSAVSTSSNKSKDMGKDAAKRVVTMPGAWNDGESDLGRNGNPWVW